MSSIIGPVFAYHVLVFLSSEEVEAQECPYCNSLCSRIVVMFPPHIGLVEGKVATRRIGEHTSLHCRDVRELHL